MAFLFDEAEKIDPPAEEPGSEPDEAQAPAETAAPAEPAE